MIKYQLPKSWILYDLTAVTSELIDAKSAILALKSTPYQLSWVEKLQKIELKREIAGTSRIEGADFTERELEEALKESPEQLLTRSQKQAHAAVKTYRWLATIPDDYPLHSDLIMDIHRGIVTGADDDHCPPGKLRGPDENVTFGYPRHRGVNGGQECHIAVFQLAESLRREYMDHDPIIRAIAAHYHLAAMHPFLDGNGRTARAVEALMLQRAGLRDSCFIAMSNYYYEEKPNYLKTLAESRVKGHDLTPFLAFALRGLALQSNRMLAEIKTEAQKAIFRNIIYDLFDRLQTPRKRVIAKRQIGLLRLLLDEGGMDISVLFSRVQPKYGVLKNPVKAFIRDLSGIAFLGAITIEKKFIQPHLEWPTKITETEFFEKLRQLPKAKSAVPKF